MINQFTGKNRWLSNFAPCKIPVLIGDNPFICDSVEHAFQAMKTTVEAEQLSVVNQPTPGKAKRAGRKVQVRGDWEAVKYGVMRNLLRLKFAPGSGMAQKLLETGNEELVEGNTWGDIVWGVSLETGQGRNMLGKLLMDVREELRGREADAVWRLQHPERVVTG